MGWGAQALPRPPQANSRRAECWLPMHRARFCALPPRHGTTGDHRRWITPLLCSRTSRDRVVTPSGVTQPCVLAVWRGRFNAAPIAIPGAATEVGDGTKTHVRRSPPNPCRPAIWTSLVLRIAHERSRRPQRFLSRTASRKRASGRQRRLMPKRSGVAEGVGEGRRPAPVQIDCTVPAILRPVVA
jgi:hypothetical protein